MKYLYFLILFLIILFLVLTLFLVFSMFNKSVRRKKYTKYAYYIHYSLILVGGLSLVGYGCYSLNNINYSYVVSGLALCFISFILFKDLNKIFCNYTKK